MHGRSGLFASGLRTYFETYLCFVRQKVQDIELSPAELRLD